jgi:hypothetical protein
MGLEISLVVSGGQMRRREFCKIMGAAAAGVASFSRRAPGLAASAAMAGLPDYAVAFKIYLR